MPGTIVGYTESQDARIARAVLEVERQKRSLILPRRRGMRRQRRRIIPFSGACMIDAANPDAQNPNNAVMSVVRTPIGSGAPDAATDQQLLVKLAYPMTTQAANAFILSKSTTTTWKTRGPATPYNSQLNCIVHWAFITADFEYEGASCASWNTKPATSALSYLENVGTTTLACERAQRAVLDDVAESAAVAAQKVAVGAARDAVRPTALTRMKQAALNALATTSVIALLWAVYRGISFYLLRGN